MDISLYTLYHVRRPRFAPSNGRDLEGRTGMSGMPSLLASLAAAGFEAEAENFFVFWDEVGPRDVRRLTERLLAARADVIGVGSLSLFLPMLVPALEAFRAQRPGAKVILGGYGPSEAAEALLAATSAVDVVVRGEGEATLVAVMQAIGDGRPLRDLPGISSRDADGIFSTPPAPRIRNLDALPFPDYERARVRDFHAMAVQLSRGCPYFCSFCSISTVWEPLAVTRTVQRAVSEMEALYTGFGLRNFVMADDTFNLSRRRVLEFSDAVRGLGHPDVWWHAFMRADRVDEEMISRMVDGGCGQVLYGIETGSQEVLDREKGGFTLADAVEVAWLTARHVETTMLCFVYGYPEETWEDFLRTVHLILSLLERDLLNRLKIILDPVFPYPSTPMAKGQPLHPVRDPRHLIKRYRAGHALAKPLLERDPRLCSFSVNLDSPALDAKHVLAVDLWEVLEGDLTLDGYLRRHEASLRQGEFPRVPADGPIARFLRRMVHPAGQGSR